MFKIYVQYIAILNVRCINCVPYSVAAIFRNPFRASSLSLSGSGTNGGKEEYYTLRP